MLMASRGQISTHSPQAVHFAAETTGRKGAGISACSGQVNKQAPQAVQRSVMEIIAEAAFRGGERSHAASPSCSR
jgi:hypothetical protein